MDIVSKEDWQMGRFYSEEELLLINYPEEDKWTLTKREYYGEEKYVFLFNTKLAQYPRYQEDEDNDESDDEGDERIFLEGDKVSSEGEEVDRPYISELHPFKTDFCLVGGQGQQLYNRHYVIDGEMRDQLGWYEDNCMQQSTRWECRLTFTSKYEIYGYAMCGSAKGSQRKEFRSVVPELNPVITLSGDMNAEVEIVVNSIDKASAEFSVEVFFKGLGRRQDVMFLYRNVTGNGDSVFCRNGKYRCGLASNLRQRLGSVKICYPRIVRDVIWNFLRQWYGLVSGVIRSCRLESIDSDSMLVLELEGDRYDLALIVTEIKKYCIYQSYLSGLRVCATQRYLKVTDSIVLYKIDDVVEILDVKDHFINPIIRKEFVSLDDKSSEICIEMGISVDKDVLYQEYGDDRVVLRRNDDNS